jgi:acyl-CoA thioester hydrolase
MLTSKIDFKIKFNEVDALGVVWHGHYIRFFEDGREAFGDRHGLAYLDIFRQGFVAPVVDIRCNYKKILEYRNHVVVETTFVDNPAAKIIFNYRIYLADSQETVAEGYSVQVFLDRDHRALQLFAPEFFLDWKKRNGL